MSYTHPNFFTIPGLYEDSQHGSGDHNDAKNLDDHNSTPRRTSSITEPGSENYDDSEQPRIFRSVADIYSNTEAVEMDEELLLMGVDEPTNYKKAAREKEWEQAMVKEMESIEKNNTWHLTELPKGHKFIGLKWFFKLKKDAEGKIIKHKARLVVKGYVQEQGSTLTRYFPQGLELRLSDSC